HPLQRRPAPRGRAHGPGLGRRRRHRRDRPAGARLRLRHVHPGPAAHRAQGGRPGAPPPAGRRVPGKRLLLPGGCLMNATVAMITARGLLGRRRIWLLVPLPLLLIGLTLVVKAFGPSPAEWGEGVIGGLGFTAVLPVIALIIGTGVLGSEIDDGTITHILSKPLPRSEIIFTKLAVATGITALFAGVPLFIVGFIAGEPALAFALVVG